MDSPSNYCFEGASPPDLERYLTPAAVAQRGSALRGVNVDLVWPPCTSTNTQSSVDIVVSLSLRRQPTLSQDGAATVGEQAPWHRALSVMIVSSSGELLGEQIVLASRGSTRHRLPLPELSEPTVVYVALTDPVTYLRQVPAQCTAPILVLPSGPSQEAQQLFARAVAALMQSYPGNASRPIEMAVLTALQTNQPLGSLSPSLFAAASTAWSEHFRSLAYDLAMILNPPVQSPLTSPSSDSLPVNTHSVVASSEPRASTSFTSSSASSQNIAAPSDVNTPQHTADGSAHSSTASTPSGGESTSSTATHEEPSTSATTTTARTNQNPLIPSNPLEAAHVTNMVHAALNQLIRFFYLNGMHQLLWLILTEADRHHILGFTFGDIALTSSQLSAFALQQLTIGSMAVAAATPPVDATAQDSSSSSSSGGWRHAASSAVAQTSQRANASSNGSALQNAAPDSNIAQRKCVTPKQPHNNNKSKMVGNDSNAAPTACQNATTRNVHDHHANTRRADDSSEAPVRRQQEARIDEWHLGGLNDAGVRMIVRLLVLVQMALLFVLVLA